VTGALKQRRHLADNRFEEEPIVIAAAPFITRVPRDAAGWASCFDVASLPILAETAETLEALRANEDMVDAHLLAETVAADPLLTLKVLAHVARLRRSRDDDTRGDPETVTAALVMLGIGPFFRAFGEQPTVEAQLADEPEALAGFRKVLRRSHRAANFALGFAVHRMDRDAPVIHEAALLHDFAELLLWLRAPALALEIAQRQAADPTLRSAALQRTLLNVELPDLQHALMLAWRLPPLLVRISDDRHADSDQVRNVLLAIRVARHSAQGWDNAALPDDVSDIADLLHLGSDPTLRLLRELDS
jgi:HD-like signal output (HDOD) protein